MNRIKSASVAGMFYPLNKDELLTQLQNFQKNNHKDYKLLSRAIIVPHAGYIYSGQLASEGFQYLSDAENIFIFAPSHHKALEYPVLSDFDGWQTPLGEVLLNREINLELTEKFNCKFDDEAFEKEHAVEVQVPFVQFLHPNAKIVPILTSYNCIEEIEKIISHYYADVRNAFVISSDLSHFHNDTEAQKIDNLTAQMIEGTDTDNMNPHQACGSAGIRALSDFVKKNNYSLIRVGMTNSASATGDKNRVVGYGSWVLSETSKSEFLKENYSDYIIDLCKKSIQAGFKNQKESLDVHVPEVFKEFGACFVTLEINGRLRGCIGSIIAHQPLIIDLLQHAYDAAFRDSRFLPLTKEEFDKLSISVSLLSSPVKMNFKDEEDLLNQIVPFKDGIIIKDGNHQAVYLPSVWEQIPDKKDFLNNLKVKAGLNPDYFSKNFEAYRFATVSVK